MAKTEQVEQELKQLSEAQERAPNKAARDQVFSEIKELQKRLRRVKQMGPFEYSHQGSLAYIGSEKAVADISWLTGNLATGGTLTYFFWRSAYLSMCFSSKWTLSPFPSYLFVFCWKDFLGMRLMECSAQPYLGRFGLG